MALSLPLADEVGRRCAVRAERVPARALRRVVDFVGASLLLLLLAPLLLGLAILVRLTSLGPVLFRQTRVGRDQRTFVMVKFRTMREGCSNEPHERYVRSLLTGDDATNSGIYKLTDDPRVTAVGRWLRRTSLDELPQLFNVLLGQMSLVGPRPVLPYEASLLDGEQLLRFAVRPGMTGLWQVSGRSRLNFIEQLELDARYVRERSLRLDLSILVRTLPAVLFGDTR